MLPTAVNSLKNMATDDGISVENVKWPECDGANHTLYAILSNWRDSRASSNAELVLFKVVGEKAKVEQSTLLNNKY